MAGSSTPKYLTPGTWRPRSATSGSSALSTSAAESGSELGDGVRLEAHQQRARQAGTTAAPGPARQAANGARGGDLRPERARHRGTITLTAAGSARTVTGSSAIGSPSAYIVNGRFAV